MDYQKLKSTINFPEVQELLTYWLDRKGWSVAPKRSDICPEDIIKLLPYIYMLDVEDDDQYIVRLWGTELRGLFDADLTGQDIIKFLPSQMKDAALRSYETIRQEKTPWVTALEYQMPFERIFSYTRLALPLIDKDGRVNMIIGMFYWDKGLADGQDISTLSNNFEACLSRIENGNKTDAGYSI